MPAEATPNNSVEKFNRDPASAVSDDILNSAQPIRWLCHWTREARLRVGLLCLTPQPSFIFFHARLLRREADPKLKAPAEGGHLGRG